MSGKLLYQKENGVTMLSKTANATPIPIIITVLITVWRFKTAHPHKNVNASKRERLLKYPIPYTNDILKRTAVIPAERNSDILP